MTETKTIRELEVEIWQLKEALDCKSNKLAAALMLIDRLTEELAKAQR